MIICLIGHSASGKSTIEKLLVEDYNLSKITSYTTRPMRKKEVDGEDYHFVSEAVFKEMEQAGEFQETAKYRDWFYGLTLKDIDYKNNHYIAVVTMHGYKELLKAVDKEDIVSIHIKVSERERMRRLLERGDDIDEIIRRIQSDRVDFMNAEKECDHIVTNEGVANAPYIVKRILSAK